MNPAGGAKLALLTTLKMSIVGSITNSSPARFRSEEHTSELQSQSNLVSRPLLEKKRTAPPLHRCDPASASTPASTCVNTPTTFHPPCKVSTGSPSSTRPSHNRLSVAGDTP